MNRIASRSWVVFLIALLLVAGLTFFAAEFLTEGGDWATFTGSPHIYAYGKVASSVVDRNGETLLDISGGDRVYSDSLSLRQATLHWVGDRDGFISTPFYDYYALALSGYDSLNGVYRYGENKPVMTLTLDADVERAALEAMDGRKGTIAVYNYKTGELLCAISTPTYDPDDVPDLSSEEAQEEYAGVYLNRFLQSDYTPGSIFKIITYAAAMDSIPDIEDQTFYCDEEYDLGGGKVTCEHWHGEQTIHEALTNSCNIAFAKIVEELGAEKLEQYIRDFAITESVSFDGLTSEEGDFDLTEAGILEVAWSGIGQYTDLVNPARFLTFLGAVANDGVEVTPHVVEKIALGDQTTYSASAGTTTRRLSKALAKTLQEGMRGNVENNYGVSSFPEGMTVCAKTGTAQGEDGSRPNAMIAGFVLDDEYPLAFFAAVEHGGYGADVCVPLMGQVLAACKEALDKT